MQRYVYEKLATGDHKTRKILVPERLRSKVSDLKVVIPEYQIRSPPHRADLRLIFNDSSTQNVELKWATSGFAKNQGEEIATAHYSNNQGYLMVVKDDRNDLKKDDWLRELDVVTIPAENFSWWFAKKAQRFLDGTIALYAPEVVVRERKYWVIYISKSGDSDKDYFNKGRPKGIWAFRYGQGIVMEDIFSINTGDIVIFAAGWKLEGGRQIYPGYNWSCNHIDIFDVTSGYYCDFHDKTFETLLWKKEKLPEKKLYMHYFKFLRHANKEKNYDGSMAELNLKGSDFLRDNKLDVEVCNAFRKSNSRRGGPANLSPDGFLHLRQKLDSLSR